MDEKALCVRWFDHNSAFFREASALRYQVYCQDRSFLEPSDYPDELEADPFDEHSIHIGVWRDNELVAYTRVILGKSSNLLPIQDVFSLDEWGDVSQFGEASRFIVKYDCDLDLCYVLVTNIAKVALERSLKSIFSVVERALLRIIKNKGIPMKPVGDARWYMGGMVIPTIVIDREVDFDLLCSEERT